MGILGEKKISKFQGKYDEIGQHFTENTPDHYVLNIKNVYKGHAKQDSIYRISDNYAIF